MPHVARLYGQLLGAADTRLACGSKSVSHEIVWYD